MNKSFNPGRAAMSGMFADDVGAHGRAQAAEVEELADAGDLVRAGTRGGIGA